MKGGLGEEKDSAPAAAASSPMFVGPPVLATDHPQVKLYPKEEGFGQWRNSLLPFM